MKYKDSKPRSWLWLSVLIGIWSIPIAASAQPRQTEEIVLTFSVHRLFTQELFVHYDGQDIYLPVVEIFNLLGMKVEINRTQKIVSGFLFSPNDKFQIDYSDLSVEALGRKHVISRSQFIVDIKDIYLRLDQFPRLFELPLTFDFSELKISMPMNKSLPIYKQLQRKKKHEKLSREEEVIRNVQHLPLRRHLISGGTLDWQLSTNPIGRKNQFFSFEQGASILGGDLVSSGGGSTDNGFDSEQWRYRWRYAVMDNKYLSQVGLGEVFTVGATGRNMTGLVVSNRRLVQRRFFQTISIRDHIGQNWEVELYVDNELVGFQTTNARGEYDFSLDLVYGNSVVRLKMYGPNGEIRTENKYFLVPFNLLPGGEFEYTAAIGETDVLGETRRYAQAQAFYGVNNWMTAGIGLEQPLAAKDGERPAMSGEIGIQAGGGLIFSSSFIPIRQLSFNGTFSRSSTLSLSSGFTLFWPDRFYNPINRKFRFIFSASAPLRIKQKLVGLRYFVSVDQFPEFRTLNMNYGLSGNAGPVNINYLGRYSRTTFPSRNISELVSQIFASVKLYRWIRPQFRVTFNHTINALDRYGVFFGRRLFKTSQISLSFERNETIKATAIQLTFHLFTGFLSSTTRALSTDRGVSVSQVHRGSIRYDRNTHSIQFDRRNSVGYGSAVIRPFLDRNYNSIMDDGEEWLPGIRPKMKGPSGVPAGSNNLHYYNRLRPYDSYLLEIDRYSLDDPSLKPVHDHYRVTVGPNVVTAIDVPVVITSEISGVVSRQLPQGSLLGVGGMKIQIMNIATEELTEITTFNDGEYYYLGLTPGAYRAYIDPVQLAQFGYTSEPPGYDFEIEPTEGGTAIENISFTIIPN